MPDDREDEAVVEFARRGASAAPFPLACRGCRSAPTGRITARPRCCRWGIETGEARRCRRRAGQERQDCDRERQHGGAMQGQPTPSGRPRHPLPFRARLGDLGTPESAPRAIVGSGPAGFYAAEHLFADAERTVEVDMFDRLPTPFGLVRAGVAPDHPKIKTVIRVYEKTAASEGFPLLRQRRDRRRRDRRRARAALPRGRLCLRDRDRPPARDPGRGPAWVPCGHRVRQLVQRPPRLRRPRVRPLGQARRRDRQRQRRRRRRPDARPAAGRARRHRHRRPRDRGAGRLGIEEIVVLGRRGPAQAAFTNPEVRELGELTDADIVIDPGEMELDRGAASTSSPRTATPRTAATSRSSPPSPGAPPRASRSGW